MDIVVWLRSLGLGAKNPWLRTHLHELVGLGDLPFVVGRGPLAREGLPPLQPDLKLDDTAPLRLSRSHFMIEKRERKLLCARPPQHAWNDR
jgi:hypothetical protein